MELVSCHPFNAQNFQAAPRFLGNFCTPEQQIDINHCALNIYPVEIFTSRS